MQNPLAGNSKIFLGVLIAGSLAATVIVSPILVSAISDLLGLQKALVVKSHSGIPLAVLKAHGIIPKDGSKAFGYGLLTDKGLDAVIVTTTHAGVLDSIKQKDKNDPVWHNHFVSLKNPDPICAGNMLQVDQITFKEPGNVRVFHDNAFLTKIPKTFTSPNSLPPPPDTTLSPGNNVEQAVSFELVPRPNLQNVEAVCVNNVTPADRTIVIP
jgi:hypothetical protein